MKISGSGDTRVTKKGEEWKKKRRKEVRHGAQIHQNASCTLANKKIKCIQTYLPVEGMLPTMLQERSSMLVDLATVGAL